MAGGALDPARHLFYNENMSDIELREHWSTFSNSGNQRRDFPSYVRTLVGIAERDPASDDIVARYIARALFLDDVMEDPVNEAMAQFAGELENPHFAAGHRHASWSRITALLDELKEKENLPHAS